MAEGKKLIVEIVGSTIGLEKALATASGQATAFGGKMQAVGSKISGVGKTLTKDLTLPLVAFGAAAVDAAVKGQESQAKLQQSVKASGESFKQYSGTLDKAVASSRTLGFTNDDTREALSKLITATGSVTKATGDLGIAQDLARFKGVDLSTASTVLSSAMAGNTRAIKTLGIAYIPTTKNVDALKRSHVDLTTEQGKALLIQAKLADKQANSAAVIDLVSKKVKGQADAYSQTAAGGMAKFRAQLNNLMEQLGTTLIPILNRVISVLQQALQWFNSLSDGTKKWVEVAAGIAAALGPTLSILGRLTSAASGLGRGFSLLAANPFLTIPFAAVAAGLYLVSGALVEDALKARAADSALRAYQATIDQLKLSLADYKQAHLNLAESQTRLIETHHELSAAGQAWAEVVKKGTQNTEAGFQAHDRLTNAEHANTQAVIDNVRAQNAAGIADKKRAQDLKAPVEALDKVIAKMLGATDTSLTFSHAIEHPIDALSKLKTAIADNGGRLDTYALKLQGAGEKAILAAIKIEKIDPAAAKAGKQTGALAVAVGNFILQTGRVPSKSELIKIDNSPALAKIVELAVKATEGGKKTSAGFLAGAGKMAAGAGKAVAGAVTAVGSAAKRGYDAGHRVGAQTGQGVVDGLQSKLGDVQRVGAEIAAAAASAMSTKLQTKSPSKVTFKLGTEVGQGLVNGMNSVAGAVAEAGGGVSKRLVDAIYTSLVAGGAKPKAAIKEALIQATAAQPSIDAAARTLGRTEAESIARGFVQASPPLWEQIKQGEQQKVREAIATATTAVTDARSAFATAFGNLATAALAAFDAKAAAWVPPAQQALNKVNFAAMLTDLTTQAGPAISDLFNQVTQAFASGNTKLGESLATQLEGTLTDSIASAQSALDAAKAAAAAAPDDADAQKRLADAQTNLDNLKTAQNTILGQIAADEQTAHDKQTAADRVHFANRLSALQTALAEHPKEHKKIEAQILKLLQDNVPEYLKKGMAQSDAIAAGLRAGIKKVNSAVDDINKAVERLTELKATLTVTVDISPIGAAAKALGGAVTAGMPYLVGERGPELFVPSQGGSIVPNNQLAPTSAGTSPNSGGTQVFQVILDRRVLAEVVRDELGRTQHRNGSTAF